MNTKTNKFQNSKIFISILTVISMILIVITGTYAWFTWSSTENTNLTMTIGRLADVVFTSGNDITTGLTPVFNYTDGESTTFSVINRDTTGATANYVVKLNITTIPTELRRTDVKYALTKNSTLVAEGDLSKITDDTSISIYTSALDSGTTNYVFYLYIDGNEENPTTMKNKTIVGELIVKEQIGIPLVTHITNLYTNNKDTTPVTNNSIEYTYASSVSLMNDRLGGATEDYDAGNIRYYGANPNNYIYFNCSNYDNQSSSTCETWRIIGVFKDIELADGTTQDLIKIVRDESIGNLAWDQDKNIDSSLTTYKASWEESSLNDFLNRTYYDRGTIDSIVYYSGSTGETATTLDMTKIGLKNASTTNMIENVVWQSLGKSTNSVYPDQVYNAERTTGETGSTTSSGKIALMYPSDYGYATDFNKCSGALGTYNTSGCYDNDWIYQANTTQWLLTPIRSGVSGGLRAWYISDTGLAYSDYTSNFSTSYVYLEYAIRPTLYLSSNVRIDSYEGTNSNPYRISV